MPRVERICPNCRCGIAHMRDESERKATFTCIECGFEKRQGKTSYHKLILFLKSLKPK